MSLSVQILLFLTILSGCVQQQNDAHPTHSRVLDNVYRAGSPAIKHKNAYQQQSNTTKKLAPPPIYNDTITHAQQKNYLIFIGPPIQPTNLPEHFIGPLSLKTSMNTR